jgi:hypothetical protein
MLCFLVAAVVYDINGREAAESQAVLDGVRDTVEQ